MSEELDDFVQWLRQWSEAYPEDVFPPVDMRAVHADQRDYSHAEVMSISARNAAAMARHVVQAVLAKAEKL